MIYKIVHVNSWFLRISLASIYIRLKIYPAFEKEF